MVLRTDNEASDAWSIPLGTRGGVTVRVHVTLAMALLAATGWAIGGASFEVGLGVSVYLASLALHEAAHALAATRVGGAVPCITLGPVGGLTPPRVPNDPKACVFVAMAAPLAHLAVVVGAACYLALRNDPSLPGLFTPGYGVRLAGLLATSGEPAVLLARVAVLVNWPLFVLNLLPAFPFDGGTALRAWFAQWIGGRAAFQATSQIALTLGLVLSIGSVLLPGRQGFPAAALTLSTVGILLVFGARRDRRQAGMGLMAGPGATPPEGRPAHAYPPADDWLDEEDETMVLVEMRQPAQEAGPPQAEAWDEQRVDAVLAKLHEKGIDRLTAEERSILQQASQRYRRRRDG